MAGEITVGTLAFGLLTFNDDPANAGRQLGNMLVISFARTAHLRA